MSDNKQAIFYTAGNAPVVLTTGETVSKAIEGKSREEYYLILKRASGRSINLKNKNDMDNTVIEPGDLLKEVPTVIGG